MHMSQASLHQMYIHSHGKGKVSGAEDKFRLYLGSHVCTQCAAVAFYKWQWMFVCAVTFQTMVNFYKSTALG